MSRPPPPAGAALDRWLERLDGQGFRVGVRERLLVQALLARLAAQGELPGELHGLLMLAAPLLCTSRELQRRYVALLEEFVAAETAPPPEPPKRWRRHADAPPRFGVQIAVLAWALALAVGTWIAHERVTTPAPQGAPSVSVGRYDGAPAPQGETRAAPFYVPPVSLPLQPTLPPGWSTPARAGVLLLGVLCALALLGAALSRRRRQMALQGVRTDDELEQHLLHDAEPVDISPHPVLARAVGRALRQRVAGEARTLDIGATLRATVAAQGAFTPRWRELQRTPEYLVLVDTRHPADHHATCAHTLVDALARAGVAVQVWAYDTTPEAGCWMRGGIGNNDAATRHRVPLATLATRSGGSRLLVFGPADVLLHPVTGELQAWATPLRTLPERAWITPVPVHAWGPAEQAADGAGFLVLPLQEAALNTLAGWFTSRRLSLALDTDTPLSVPALLRGSALDWVTRSDAPPPETVQALMLQLRRMLGGTRYQWLCACAVFPALTPPLTLALGQQLVADPRGLALGLASLSALPWFRYGRMPAWLRRELLQQLTPEMRGTLAGEVRQRLDSALDAGEGPVLADLATRKRRRLLALQQARGPLRDVVLADFVREDTDPGLAQQLPEGLRRRLFKGGDPTQGWRPAVLAVPAVIVVAAIVAATPLWPALVGTVPQPALVAQQKSAGRDEWPRLRALAQREPLVLRAIGEAVIERPAASPAEASQFEFASTDLSRTPQPVELTPGRLALLQPMPTVHPDGLTLQLIGNRIQLLDAQGQPVGAPLSTGGPGVLAAAFTPGGGRVVALADDASLHTWGRRWPAQHVLVVDCAGADLAGGRAGILARHITGLGQTDISQTLAVSATVWPELWGPDIAPPAAGEILIDNEGLREGARLVADALRQQAPAGSPSSWNVRVASIGTSNMALGLCGPQDAAPPPDAAAETLLAAVGDLGGLDPASALNLARRVRQLFAQDAATRRAAAAALVQDREALSDAVPLAVAAAWRAQASRASTTEAVQNGIFNVLVVLQSAPPASLNRARADITRLLDGVRGNGAATAAQVALVQKKLDAIASQRPMIHLAIANEAQRPLATQLTQRLQANGLQVSGIVNLGEPSNAETLIGVLGFSDRAIARALLRASSTIVGRAAKMLPSPSLSNTNDRYEVLFDRDLCLTRPVAGCDAAVSPAQQAAAVQSIASRGKPASDRLVDLVAGFEGIADGDPGTSAIDPFLDATQTWSIGYGHPIIVDSQPLRGAENRALARNQAVTIAGVSVSLENGINIEQARALLRDDLNRALANVDQLVEIPLSQNQREALGSFVFNVGTGVLRSSTLLKMLNAGDSSAVPAQLLRYSTINGKAPPGLQRRRQAEVDLWNGTAAAAPNIRSNALRKSAK